MLPMRSAATLTLLFVAVVAAGCRGNSATPLTNPFLTPDRVPPPSTQALAPGMAAPYYQGDAMPSAAPMAAPTMSMPGTAMPGIPAIPAATAPPNTYSPAPGAIPPASAYPGAIYPPASTQPNTAYPTSPVTPATPPVNYGGYSPQAKGESIGVPQDGQSLRFAAATLSPTTTPSDASAAVAAQSSNAQFRTPIQSMLPQPGTSPQNSVDRAFTPNAGAQPPSSTTGQVIPAGYAAPITAATAAASLSKASGASPDGFRPQGSQPRAETPADSPTANGFRPPSMGKQTAGGDNPTGRFGVGPTQEWLRGQLEYWPEAGEWSINYMDEGAKDQIGGRVLIDNPQVLGNLPAGEFVMIEGQLYGRQIDENYYRPAYRISTVQRQRQ
jgi:hypothetical protein